MQIIKINNPFQRQDRDIESIQYKNQTIEDLLIEYLRHVGKEYEIDCSLQKVHDDFCISVNGLIVPYEFWNTTKPRENDQIIIMPVIRGGGGGDSKKQILNAIVMIATIVAAPWALGALGFVAGTTAMTIGTIAVVVGTGMLLQALTPTSHAKSPGALGGDWSSSQTYSWNPTTLQQQGIPIPRFYGRNRIYGNVIAVHTGVDNYNPLSFTILSSGGLWGRRIQSSHTFTRGTATSNQLLMTLISLGQGPVQGIVEGSIIINDQPSTNYSDVTTEERKGLLEQEPVAFFNYTKAEFISNRVVTNSGEHILYTTPDNDFDDLEVELLFNRGIYFANDSGGLSNHSIGIKVEIRIDGTSDYVTMAEQTITDKTTSPKRVCFTTAKSVPEDEDPIVRGNRYVVRIHKTSADKTSARYGDEVRLGCVREVFNDKFRYPKQALLGIEALATNQLSGSMSVSCIQEGAIINVYDGADWNLEYSTNPAWVLWDILTRPVISGDGSSGAPYTIERYDGLDPTRLDLPKFFELAEFCDYEISDGEGGTEKRVTFNGGFDVGTTVWEAALKVCEIARCIPFWNGIVISLAIDTVSSPVQMFNVADIIKDSFKETFLPQSELISEIEVHYRDELQDFERVPFTIQEPNINTNNKVTLELFGITKQSEAWRAGMFRLAQNRYIKSSIEFGVDIDAIACTIGNVVYVQHDVPEWGTGGRVVSASSLHFIADKDLSYVAGSTYEVIVRKADDTLNERTVTSQYNDIVGIDQENKQFEIPADFSDEYKKGDIIRVSDSTGNDGDYTLAEDALGESGVTKLTVVESIPDTTADGGLYNLRRVVVSAVFKNADDVEEAPAKDDIFSFGIQNVAIKQYRIISMRKASDQTAVITLAEYNALIYGPDEDEPVIPITGYVSPPRRTLLAPPITNDGLLNVVPEYIVGTPNFDVPLPTNLLWLDNSSGEVEWAAADGINLIWISMNRESYPITPGTLSESLIYWDEVNPNIMQGTDDISVATAPGCWVMCYNDGGIAYPAFAQKVIHGGLIQADTLVVGTANITNLSVTTIKLASEATRILVSSFAAAPFPISYVAQEILSRSIVSVGGAITISASWEFSCTSWGAEASFMVKLKRDDTTLFEHIYLAALSVPGSKTFTETPGVGAYSYRMTAYKRTGPMTDAEISKRNITLDECKGK